MTQNGKQGEHQNRAGEVGERGAAQNQVGATASGDELDVGDNLRTYVESFVAPLAFSASRKREVAEEMFAHLFAVYEQELLRGMKPCDACRNARRRFGEQNALIAELRTAVPWVDRVLGFVASRRARIMWRWIIIGIIGVLVGMGLVMPAVAALRGQGHIFGEQVALLTLGVVLTLGGVGSTVFGGVRILRARNC